uniref:ZPR1 jelly-roll domain-containing protein n=1 Tax=Physcomitrium patens TaxID=3218 RepID=A0A2K1JI35_PHYPA|nr:hypothetical protein PHYPA_018617 [Physcomitrium patens]
MFLRLVHILRGRQTVNTYSHPAFPRDKVLNRQVVNSDAATIKVSELKFEVPPQSQRGTLYDMYSSFCE